MLKTVVLAVVFLRCFIAADTPSFEIASIKLRPWTNEGRVAVFVQGNTLRGEHVDLYRLIEFAYDLRTDGSQVSGGPGWAHMGILSNVSGAESVLFQMVAKPPTGQSPSIEQFRLMLQALLADRFQLRVHRAKRDLPVFNLVVAARGPKLQENTSDSKPSLSMRDGRLFRIRAAHAGIRSLVDELSNPNHGAGRTVIDKTGLTAFYDFEIDWAPDNLGGDTSGPSVFAALQDVLGLKLEPGLAPFDTVIIDHAAKPSQN